MKESLLSRSWIDETILFKLEAGLSRKSWLIRHNIL